MLLASPAVPQTQETRKVCVSTFLPNQYAQILIYCKSFSHAHQLWYQAQTFLTKYFIVIAAYQQATTNSLPVGLRSSTTADKAFQHLKAQLVITKSVFKLKMVGDTFETFGEVSQCFSKNYKTYAL